MARRIVLSSSSSVVASTIAPTHPCSGSWSPALAALSTAFHE